MKRHPSLLQNFNVCGTTGNEVQAYEDQQFRHIDYKEVFICLVLVFKTGLLHVELTVLKLAL